MSVESALEFVARLQRDSRFRRAYTAAKIESRASQFLADNNFSFNEPELEAARENNGFNLADPEVLKDIRGTEDEMGGVMVAFCGCNQPTAPESTPSNKLKVDPDRLQRPNPQLQNPNVRPEVRTLNPQIQRPNQLQTPNKPNSQ